LGFILRTVRRGGFLFVFYWKNIIIHPMKRFRKYHEAVEYLENLPLMANGSFEPAASSRPDFYLKKMAWFLDLLGNPHRGMKYVHVTGTSGKGSVSTMIQNILTASGKKTGLFTSPFPTTSIEKISIDGTYVYPDEFVGMVDELKPLIGKSADGCPWGRPSYFEIFMLMGFLHFKRKGCEWVVLEVGCGGRHDASNVIEKNEISVITNIGHDHMQIIGDTLEKIAFEKVGIVKEGSALFTTEKDEELLAIFKNECEQKNARMTTVPNMCESVVYGGNRMKVRLPGIENEIDCKLWGDHQARNISLAYAISKHLGISNESIVEGISKADLPCRFEIVRHEPLVILDGAHNKEKIKSTVSNLEKLEYRKLFLVVGISETKEAEKILERIIPKADYVVATNLVYGKSVDPERLKKMSTPFLKAGAVFETEPALFEAANGVLEKAEKNDAILITGSFYVAGELRKKWISEDYILENLRSF